jgi:DNA-directed RNA polymerase subunit RPC12/RpoP
VREVLTLRRAARRGGKVVAMGTNIMCPECGGLMYSTARVVPRGAKVCQCSAQKSGGGGWHRPGESLVKHKVCVGCGKDVTHDKRMKDHEGQYWCVACGTEDRKKKQSNAHGVMCPDCHLKYPADKLRSIDGTVYCEGCYNIRKRTKADLTKKLGKVGRSQRELFGRKVQVGIAALLLVAAGLAVVHWVL